MFSKRNAIFLYILNSFLLYNATDSLARTGGGIALILLIPFFPLVFILRKGDWSGGYSAKAMRSYEGSPEGAMKFFGWVLLLVLTIVLAVKLIKG